MVYGVDLFKLWLHYFASNLDTVLRLCVEQLELIVAQRQSESLYSVVQFISDTKYLLIIASRRIAVQEGPSLSHDW